MRRLVVVRAGDLIELQPKLSVGSEYSVENERRAGADGNSEDGCDCCVESVSYVR
jgi:hypothetical protein